MADGKTKVKVTAPPIVPTKRAEELTGYESIFYSPLPPAPRLEGVLGGGGLLPIFGFNRDRRIFRGCINRRFTI